MQGTSALAPFAPPGLHNQAAGLVSLSSQPVPWWYRSISVDALPFSVYALKLQRLGSVAFKSSLHCFVSAMTHNCWAACLGKPNMADMCCALNG